jgi:hypothetical protein
MRAFGFTHCMMLVRGLSLTRSLESPRYCEDEATLMKWCFRGPKIICLVPSFGDTASMVFDIIL